MNGWGVFGIALGTAVVATGATALVMYRRKTCYRIGDAVGMVVELGPKSWAGYVYDLNGEQQFRTLQSTRAAVVREIIGQSLVRGG